MTNVQRYCGVRQRHWGSWVSEIYHPVLKRRIWRGIYKTEEDAVRVYEEAAWLVGKPGARTTFPLSGRASILSMTLHAKLEKLCKSSLVQGKDKAARTRINVQREEEAKEARTGDSIAQDEEAKSAIEEMIKGLRHSGSMEIIHFSTCSSIII